MVTAVDDPPSPWSAVALEKLGRVLGPERAQTVLRETMLRAGLRALDTPDDLFRLGCTIETIGGFAGTVGSLLALHAVMRGAAGKRG